MNGTIFSSTMCPIFLIILIICGFVSVENVAITFIRADKCQISLKGSDIYAGIIICGCSDFHIIRNLHLIERRHKDEISRSVLATCVATIENDFMLMEDNCRPHRAYLVDDILSMTESYEQRHHQRFLRK